MPYTTFRNDSLVLCPDCPGLYAPAFDATTWKCSCGLVITAEEGLPSPNLDVQIRGVDFRCEICTSLAGSFEEGHSKGSWYRCLVCGYYEGGA